MLSTRTEKRLHGLARSSMNGHKVRDVYRVLTGYPDLWAKAYADIKGNQGALTPGIDADTLDGFCWSRVIQLQQALKEGMYRPKPVRRTLIPKANGKRRPLGISSGTDKLVQSAVKIILEAIYEPVFSDHSHGFRPKRSCHTALEQVRRKWTGVKWFIKIDIKGCFDEIDHSNLVAILGKKIEDKRFLRLIQDMLKAGYMEDWRYHATYSGTPQGGIASPIMANIYLHELDQWIETLRKDFDCGKSRASNREYVATASAISRCKRKLKKLTVGTQDYECTKKEIADAYQRLWSMPSQDQMDPSYKRLRYCRYADDSLLGIIGAKDDARQILRQVEGFLQEVLRLELSQDKTKITNSKDFITFLGYDIHTFKSDRVRKVQNPHGKTNRRTNQGYISLHIPKVKMQQFMKSHGAGSLEDSRRTQARAGLQNTSDYEIITKYNVEIRGFCHYYALAHRAKYHLQHLVGAWHFSLVKTLAGKHQSSMLKIVKKYKVGNEGGIALVYPTQHGPRVLREFKLADWKPKPVGYEDVDIVKTHHLGRVDTLDRLNAGICEYCGVAESLEVHHIHKMKDVKNGKEPWQILMTARQRKTMVLCHDCHRKLHQGTLPSPTNPTALRLMESGMP